MSETDELDRGTALIEILWGRRFRMDSQHDRRLMATAINDVIAAELTRLQAERDELLHMNQKYVEMITSLRAALADAEAKEPTP